MANSQMQAQANAQVAQATSEGKIAEIGAQSQLDLAKIEADKMAKLELLDKEYALRMQLEQMRLGINAQVNAESLQQKASLEEEKEDRKDERVKKQAVEQSKLISQRQGQRPELTEEEGDDILNMILNQ
jgi:hypothetical protein